jgi:hypothetical protein
LPEDAILSANMARSIPVSALCYLGSWVHRHSTPFVSDVSEFGAVQRNADGPLALASTCARDGFAIVGALQTAKRSGIALAD